MLSIRAAGAQQSAFNNLGRVEARLLSTTQKLATGLRINSGSDDPAGLFAAEQLRGDLLASRAQQRNLSAERFQVELRQTGRQLAVGVMQDMRGLVVQASGDTISDEQRAAIQTEIDSSLDGLERIASATGIDLSADLQSLRAEGDNSIVTGDPAAAAELIDEQISATVTASAEEGAYQRYSLDVAQRLAEDQEVIAARSLSQIEDADFASETANLARDEIAFRSTLKVLSVLNSLRGEGLANLLDLEA